MNELSPYAIEQLEKIYDDIQQKLFGEDQESNVSPVLLEMMKKNNNERSKVLRETSLNMDYLDQEVITELTISGCAEKIANSNNLCITAKGIWAVYQTREENALDILLNSIQQKYFDIFEKVTITGKNKVMLFAMIAMRTFNFECCVDLRKDKNMSDNWKEVLLEVDDFLISKKVITAKDGVRKTLNEEDVSGIEDAVSNVIRHSDKVPRFTNNIFTKSAHNQYWLELTDRKNKIKTKDLAMIIKLLLDKHLTDDNYNEYAQFANDLCQTKGYLFMNSFENDDLLSCTQDDAIISAFQQACLINLG